MKHALLLALMVVGILTKSLAVDYTVNATGGLASNAATYTPNGNPGLGDRILFSAGFYIFQLDVNMTVTEINIGATFAGLVVVNPGINVTVLNYVQAGGQFIGNAVNGTSMNVFGNYSVTAGSYSNVTSLYLTSGGTVSGAAIAAWNGANSTVFYTGGDVNVLAVAHNNADFNGPGPFNLVGATSASGIVNMVAGFVIMGNNDFTVSNSAVGSITNASSASYFMTNNLGRLFRQTSAGNSYSYPVGTVFYNLTVLNTVSNSASIGVRIANTGISNGITVGPVISQPGASSFSVSMDFDPSQTVGNYTSVNLVTLPGMSYQDGATISGNTATSTTSMVLNGPFGFANQSLPVEYAYFKGVEDNGKVLLSWATLWEKNTQKFDVEHSIDGGITFKKIASLVAIGGGGAVVGGNTNTEYEYTHTKPVNGKNVYRLQQVDFNGAVNTSNTVEVTIMGGTDNIAFTVTDKGTVLIEHPTGKTLTAKAVNLIGQTVAQQSCDCESISLGLEPGVYTFSLTDSQGKSLGTKKVAVQRWC